MPVGCCPQSHGKGLRVLPWGISGEGAGPGGGGRVTVGANMTAKLQHTPKNVPSGLLGDRLASRQGEKVEASWVS